MTRFSDAYTELVWKNDPRRKPWTVDTLQAAWLASAERLYRESEADIAAACARLARYGIDARHLRTFVNATGRQATLVEQLVAPGLRSRNQERRKSALEDLESLARVAQELSYLLFVRDLRAVVERSG